MGLIAMSEFFLLQLVLWGALGHGQGASVSKETLKFLLDSLYPTEQAD